MRGTAEQSKAEYAEPKDEALERDLREWLESRRIKADDTLIEKWLSGYGALREIFGVKDANRILNESLFPEEITPLGHSIHAELYNFSKEGWGGALAFFGKARAQEAINQWGRLELFAFTEKQWGALAEALGDTAPHDLTWDIALKDHPRAWIGGTDLIRERKQFMDAEEFRITVNSPALRGLLVHDGRRPDWPLFLGNEKGVRGLEPDLRENPVIDQEKWRKWKDILGAHWLDLLKCDIRPEMLESHDPEALRAIAKQIPDFFARLVREPNAVNLLDTLLNSKRSGRKTGFLDKLNPAQRAALLGQTLSNTLELLYWYEYQVETSGLWWRAIRRACSSKYLEKLLQEQPPFTRGLGVGFFFPEAQERINLEKYFHERETIDNTLAQDSFLAKYRLEHPAVTPYLRLRFAYAREQHMTEEVAIRTCRDLARAMDSAGPESFDPELIPSIGLEIEIMEKTPMKSRPPPEYLRTSIFGIPQGFDEQWEFSMEPLNIAAQARAISEMIRQGWIDKEYARGAHYSLHVNVGIPEGLAPNEQAVGPLVYALVSAYGEKTRLQGGEYGTLFDLDYPREGEQSALVKEVGGARFGGRLEIRAFSVEAETIYRLLYDTAALSGALFASLRHPPRDKRDSKLAEIWDTFKKEVETLFAQNNLQTDRALLQNPETAIQKILALQAEMKTRMRRAVREIRTIARAKARGLDKNFVPSGKI